MGNQLSPYAMNPVLDCIHEEGSGPGFRYGAAIMQGWRKNQEDTFKCDLQPFMENYQYFGVFDGHGGAEVAKYLQNRLHKDVRAFLSSHKDPELALQMAFFSCDTSLREPSGIKELNDIVEAENANTVANIEKNRREIFNRINFGAGCSKDSGECSETTNIILDHRNEECCVTDGAECSKDDKANKCDTDSSKDNVGGSKDELGSSHNEPGCSNDPASHDGNLSNCNIPSGSDTQEESETMSVDDPDDMEVANTINEGFSDTLKYLLKEKLEESDPEDQDFNVEDAEFSSDSGEEDTFEDMEAMEPGVHSGSTGTVLLMDGNKFYCANVGDSRCVMCQGGKAIDMSLDHKPDDPEEKKRIVATGSYISDGRINKSLNLSRAFGDFYYKDMDLAPFEQCVTVEPTINSFSVKDNDEFIIIASDGIWNSMSSQEVVDFVKLRLQETDNLSEIGEELFRLILASDTEGDGTGCDNMTFVLILLNPSSLRNSKTSSNLESSHSKQIDQII